MKPLLVIIGGPTGIGKTTTGIELAKHFNSEIISADSRQFYKEMTIGTAVPSRDELETVKHYFIHNLSVDSYFNASDFEVNTIKLLTSLFKQHKIVFMVGGSGLYIDAVLKGIDYLPTIPKEVRNKYQEIFEIKGIEEIRKLVYKTDPLYYNQVDKNNHKRMLKALEVFDITGKPYSSFLKKSNKIRDFNTLFIALDKDRDKLYDQINKRVNSMIDRGLVEEARKMHPKKDLTPLKTVGYKELFEYFENKISLEEAITQIKNHSRAYARRQLTWFRRYKDAHWFNPDEINEMTELISQEMNK